MSPVCLRRHCNDQGRFDDAQQMLDQARAASHPDKADAISLTQAKLLARRGQSATARQFVGQVEALISPSSPPVDHADVLEVKAEIERLAGAPAQAAASLRAAIEIYDGVGAIALAEKSQSRPHQPHRLADVSHRSPLA